MFTANEAYEATLKCVEETNIMINNFSQSNQCKFIIKEIKKAISGGEMSIALNCNICFWNYRGIHDYFTSYGYSVYYDYIGGIVQLVISWKGGMNK